jgi:hypothetical protein
LGSWYVRQISSAIRPWASRSSALLRSLVGWDSGTTSSFKLLATKSLCEKSFSAYNEA